MTTTFVSAEPAPAHTLVAVFLRGGADALTLVPPVDDDAYHRARPQLRVHKEDALPLNDIFALHPALAPLHRHYLEGQLAVVHAVGSEDDTRSHFEAQDLMEHAGPAGGGWLGRFLRAQPRAGSNPLTAVAMGTAAPESLRGAPASVALDSFETFSFGDDGAQYLAQLEQLYAHAPGELAQVGRDAIQATHRLQDLSRGPYTPSHNASYATDDFGRGMQRVAQLIKARIGLEAATVDLGGWDSHFAQGPLMAPLMRSLAQNLAAFADDLGPGMAHVTITVMSEFGRRVFENASFGTDHGRGGVMFVMGGGVAGGRVYGAWPGLDTSALDGPGDVPVTTNYRDVLAAVLGRCSKGVALGEVFPEFEIRPVAMYA